MKIAMQIELLTPEAHGRFATKKTAEFFKPVIEGVNRSDKDWEALVRQVEHKRLAAEQ